MRAAFIFVASVVGSASDQPEDPETLIDVRFEVNQPVPLRFQDLDDVRNHVVSEFMNHLDTALARLGDALTLQAQRGAEFTPPRVEPNKLELSLDDRLVGALVAAVADKNS